MSTLEFPHLTDQESVRAEAAQQYGGLDNAASFIQAQKATHDPNVAAASLRQINPEETEKVRGDLSIAQKLIDKEYGGGEYEVIDAVVRGDALSAIGLAPDGTSHHLVAGYTDRYKPVVESASQRSERIAQASETARGRLGSEARAEVQRLVAEATEKIMSEVSERFGKANEEIDKTRSKATEEAEKEEEKTQKASGSGSGSRSRSRSGSRSRKGGGKSPSRAASRGNEASDEGQPAKGPSSEA